MRSNYSPNHLKSPLFFSHFTRFIFPIILNGNKFPPFCHQESHLLHQMGGKVWETHRKLQVHPFIHRFQSASLKRWEPGETLAALGSRLAPLWCRWAGSGPGHTAESSSALSLAGLWASCWRAPLRAVGMWFHSQCPLPHRKPDKIQTCQYPCGVRFAAAQTAGLSWRPCGTGTSLQRPEWKSGRGRLQAP